MLSSPVRVRYSGEVLRPVQPASKAANVLDSHIEKLTTEFIIRYASIVIAQFHLYHTFARLA